MTPAPRAFAAEIVPGRAPVDLMVATEPGSLVIFNGDKVHPQSEP